MFGGKKEIPKGAENTEVTTLIGEGCEFEGNLNLSASTRIDGKVKGNIRSEGTLIIGESGSVDGDISCSEILVHGKVFGNVEAQRLELKRGASLTGDLKVEVLIIEEGAIYNGNCSMGRSSMDELSSTELKD